MDELVRSFIAARLGRGSVVTVVDNDGNGIIKVTFGIGQCDLETAIVLNATSDEVRCLGASGITLAFILSRIAISQTQKLFIASRIDDVSIVDLDPTVLPWNGDLTVGP